MKTIELNINELYRVFDLLNEKLFNKKMNWWAKKEFIIIRYEFWVISRLLKKCRDKNLEKSRLKDYL